MVRPARGSAVEAYFVKASSNASQAWCWDENDDIVGISSRLADAGKRDSHGSYSDKDAPAILYATARSLLSSKVWGR